MSSILGALHGEAGNILPEIPMTLVLPPCDATPHIPSERRGTDFRIELQSHRRSMAVSSRSADWRVSPSAAGGAANGSRTMYLPAAVRL